MASYLSAVTGIGWGVKLGFVLAGVALSISLRSDLANFSRQIWQAWQAKAWMTKAVMLVFSILALYKGSIASIFYDTPHYHLQAIQWIQAFPAVPGLGNLHTRFAYNSHFFIPSALFSVSFSETRAIYPLNSFFYLLIGFRLLADIDKSMIRKDWGEFLLKAFLLALFAFYQYQYVNTSGTDLIIAFLTFYVFILFLDSAFKAGKEAERLVLWAVLFAAITFKLSAMFLLVLLPFTYFGGKLKQGILLSALIGLLFMAPFFYRNVVLSGYLVYPLPQLDFFSVDWKIPVERAVLEQDYSGKYAHMTYEQMLVPTVEEQVVNMDFVNQPFAQWLSEWYKALNFKWNVILLANLLLIAPFVFNLRKGKYAMAIVQFAILFNAGMWLATAPDPRFAAGILYWGFAATAAFFIVPLWKKLNPGRLLYYGFLIIGLLLPLLYTLYKQKLTMNQALSALVSPAELQQADTQTFPVINGDILVPSSGYLCYNAPIPCAPPPPVNLAFRGHSLKEGFKIAAPGERGQRTSSRKERQ